MHRIRCTLILIDDDDRNVQLIARYDEDHSYAVALTVGVAAASRRRSLRLLVELLRRDGCVVDLGVGESTALERLSRPPEPDVLLADVDQGIAAFLRVARHARSQAPTVPLVVVTSRAEEMAKELAELEPRPFVLEKPLDYDALKQLLLRQAGPSKSGVLALHGGGPEAARRAPDRSSRSPIPWRQRRRG